MTINVLQTQAAPGLALTVQLHSSSLLQAGFVACLLLLCKPDVHLHCLHCLMLCMAPVTLSPAPFPDSSPSFPIVNQPLTPRPHDPFSQVVITCLPQCNQCMSCRACVIAMYCGSCQNRTSPWKAVGTAITFDPCDSYQARKEEFFWHLRSHGLLSSAFHTTT